VLPSAHEYGVGDAVRQKLAAVTNRFPAFEAEALNVHVDYSLFQQLASPITSGQTRVPGINRASYSTASCMICERSILRLGD
jgi:hypothetical protein